MTRESGQTIDVLVVGAGMAGLIAAAELQRAGAVEEWRRGLGDSPDAHVRWRGHPAMTSVAKYLARGIEIVLDTRVVALRASRHQWSAETAEGRGWVVGGHLSWIGLALAGV